MLVTAAHLPSLATSNIMMNPGLEADGLINEVKDDDKYLCPRISNLISI